MALRMDGKAIGNKLSLKFGQGVFEDTDDIDVYDDDSGNKQYFPFFPFSFLPFFLFSLFLLAYPSHPFPSICPIKKQRNNIKIRQIIYPPFCNLPGSNNYDKELIWNKNKNKPEVALTEGKISFTAGGNLITEELK